MNEETLKILWHIFDARIDNARNNDARMAWKSAKTIIEYAVENNVECLRQFDYLRTTSEELFLSIYEACKEFGVDLVCSPEFLESHNLM